MSPASLSTVVQIRQRAPQQSSFYNNKLRFSDLTTELEKLIEIGDTWTYEIAQVQAYLGNLDESFRWLHRAIDRRDQSLYQMTGDPFLDNLRADPRFEVVLEQLGRKVSLRSRDSWSRTRPQSAKV